MLDLHYVMLAALEGALASRDRWLVGLFRIVRPDGQVSPVESRAWKGPW